MRRPPPLRRALFVDRDGTLNPDPGYIQDPARLELYRGVGDALRLARDHGYFIVCVTNQSGVERGFYTRDDVERVHGRLNELLERDGARIDAFYYCPHHPDRHCDCRKPGTALFERARLDHHLDFAGSAVVGDRALDVEAGRRLNLLTALVRTPNHAAAVDRELREMNVTPDLVSDTFIGAVLRILGRG